MSSQVVKSLCGSLPSGHSFKIFSDNFFTSLALVGELEKDAIHFVGTVTIPILKNCPLMAEKDLKSRNLEQLIIETKQTAILLLSNGMTIKLSHSFPHLLE